MRCYNFKKNANKNCTARQMAAKLLTIYNNGEKAVKQRLETLVACGNDLVKNLQKKHEFKGDNKDIEHLR